MTRISKKDYYLNIAREVAKRSTCLRRQYGAVIVRNDEVLSTGYNGSVRGSDNCCDIGMCWREVNHIPHGEQYEKCVAVHAEQNAIISAARQGVSIFGSDIYLVGFEHGKPMAAKDVKPCLICARFIVNAGIKNIITEE